MSLRPARVAVNFKPEQRSASEQRRTIPFDLWRHDRDGEWTLMEPRTVKIVDPVIAYNAPVQACEGSNWLRTLPELRA
eukprot:tig00000114_g6035.t1